MTSSDLSRVSSVTLFSLCARNREDSALWSEFLRRIALKIRQFIRGTMRQSIRGTDSSPWVAVLSEELQESDLFQSTIVRLVENDCAAMKRFSGGSDEELLAYLAVITRSVVRDWLRRQRAKKRLAGRTWIEPFPGYGIENTTSRISTEQLSAERNLLAREIMDLSERSLESLEGGASDRDRLIFELHFFHDLSLSQIAQCKGINLSKGGVEKVIHRLLERLRTAAAIDISEASMQ